MFILVFNFFFFIFLIIYLFVYVVFAASFRTGIWAEQAISSARTGFHSIFPWAGTKHKCQNFFRSQFDSVQWFDNLIFNHFPSMIQRWWNNRFWNKTLAPNKCLERCSSWVHFKLSRQGGILLASNLPCLEQYNLKRMSFVLVPLWPQISQKNSCKTSSCSSVTSVVRPIPENVIMYLGFFIKIFRGFIFPHRITTSKHM